MLIGVDREDTSLWRRVGSLRRQTRHVGVGVKWGTLEDDIIGWWVVLWKNAGRVVRSDELDNSVKDVFKGREKINHEVDAVGCNGS